MTTEREAYEAQLLADFGPIGKQYNHDADPAQRQVLTDPSGIPVGVACGPLELPPVGSGFRLSRQTGAWVPDLRTAAGRRRQAELDRLRTPTSGGNP